MWKQFKKKPVIVRAIQFTYGGIITLRSNCDRDILIHELAHHKNFKDKIRLNHGIEFEKAYDSIQ